jgi:hypothetical protein
MIYKEEFLTMTPMKGTTDRGDLPKFCYFSEENKPLSLETCVHCY